VPSSAEAGAAERVAERAWAALAAALALASCLVFILGSAAALDWQPALAWHQPWRAWSAAWVHYSALHLAANLTGCLLVAALGVTARVPLRIVVAWLIAWPLTQFALLLQPGLLHYGGLSGVLHAGVAAVAVHLIVSARGTRRLVGIGVLVGVALKVFLEAPGGDALRHPDGWDIAVAPFAHLTGLVAGVATAGIAEAVRRRRPTTIDRND
jgi:rhomboid family GlyGly-CTERM serine protease